MFQEKEPAANHLPFSHFAIEPAPNGVLESEHLLELFFFQSLDGFFFMMLDEPVRWDDTVDKEKVLDYVFAHQRITKVNDAMLAQYGATREQFLGLTPNDFYQHDLAHGREVWRRFFDAGGLHVETDERKFDGTPMWIEGDYICFYDAESRITGHFGIQREVTERKRAEEALRQYNTRLKILQEIDRALLSRRVGSPEQIAQAAMQHIQELVPCLRASVLDEDGRHLEVLTSQEELLYVAPENIKGRLLHQVFSKSIADRYLSDPDSAAAGAQGGRSVAGQLFRPHLCTKNG
jgi:PAS domain S-box-containing protein